MHLSKNEYCKTVDKHKLCNLLNQMLNLLNQMGYAFV